MVLVFFGSLAPAMGSENIQQTVQVWENSANLLEVSEKIALDDLATLGTSCSWLLDRPPYKYYSCRTYRIKKGIYRTYRSDSKQKWRGKCHVFWGQIYWKWTQKSTNKIGSIFVNPGGPRYSDAAFVPTTNIRPTIWPDRQITGWKPSYYTGVGTPVEHSRKQLKSSKHPLPLTPSH